VSGGPPITSVQLLDLAELIGDAAALRLAEVYGGQDSLYVPKRPRHDHSMANVLGPDAFDTLCWHYGGERIDVPRNANAETTKTRILQMDDGTASRNEIARRLGCTARYVRMVCNAGKDPDQGDLL